MSSSSTQLPIPEGPGSVSEAPNLPAGFTDTVTSRHVDTGELRQHAVIGRRPPRGVGGAAAVLRGAQGGVPNTALMTDRRRDR